MSYLVIYIFNYQPLLIQINCIIIWHFIFYLLINIKMHRQKQITYLFLSFFSWIENFITHFLFCFCFYKDVIRLYCFKIKKIYQVSSIQTLLYSLYSITIQIDHKCNQYLPINKSWFVFISKQFMVLSNRAC